MSKLIYEGNIIYIIMVFLIAISFKGINLESKISKGLIRLTPYTLYIYLIHTWVTAPTRISLEKWEFIM